MTGTHVVPDRHTCTMGTHQVHLAWFTYNCCTESYTPPPVDLSPIPHLLLYVNFQNFSFSTACDMPSIEVDTKEQVARHNLSIYIHIRTTNRQRTTQIKYP